MVRLTKWDEIDLRKIQQGNVERDLSANTIFVLRTLESIFEGNNSHVQAHQCIQCGNFFMIGEDNVGTLKDDKQGGKLCMNCAGQEDPNIEKTRRWKKLVEITDTLRKWEQDNENVEDNFNKIKEVAKGFFEFNSEREMYVEYHKFSKQVNEENKELGTKLEDKFAKIIDELFEKAKEENTEEFVKFIFGINHEEEKEILETIHMLQASVVRGEMEYWLPKISDQITLSLGIKTKEGLDRLRFKLLLLQYAHLVEFGFIYDVMYNLALISQKKSFVSNPFPSSNEGIPIYPIEKISKINDENHELAEIIRKYYVGNLRNAISHTKYLIKGDFVFKSDKKNWKMSKTQVKDKNTLARSVFRYLLSKLAHEQTELMKNGLTAKNKDTFSVTFSDEK